MNITLCFNICTLMFAVAILIIDLREDIRRIREGERAI